MGKHLIRTDQKEYAGGEDSAPAPFDYFLASLVTCAGIFVKVFCDQRGIDSSGIKLFQSHQNDRQTRKLSAIEIEIHLPDDFPEKYREAVIKAAEQCSVKRVIKDPPDIRVSALSA